MTMEILAEAVQPSLDPPGDDEVLHALQRILGSADFGSSDRKRKFLKYVVEETLSGRADRLKGYSIALTVFDRDASFDAQADSLVRVEAGRLRQSLEHYYLTAGRSESVRIIVPKGSYVPTFYRVKPATAPEPPFVQVEPSRETALPARVVPARGTEWKVSASVAAFIAIGAIGLTIYNSTFSPEPAPAIGAQQRTIGPSLRVEPLSSIGSAADEVQFTAGLTEEITVALARFKSMRLSSGVNKASGPRTALIPQGYDYVLKGSVRMHDRTYRVAVHLEDAQTHGLLWTRIFDGSLASTQGLTFQTDIAAAVAETLGDPYSVLFTNELRRISIVRAAVPDPYGCVLNYYAYREKLSAREHRELRECHETITKTVPLYTEAWINLAWLYLDEHRFDYNRSDPGSASLERAANAARHATALDPDNARAHLATAVIEWFRSDLKAFDRHAAAALSLNANDPEVNAELGLRYALRGDWERALRLLDRAMDLAPIRRRPYRIAYALHELDQGNYAAALEEVERTGLVDHPAALLFQAAVLGLSDRHAESRAAWRAAIQKVPRIRNDPRAWIVSRGVSDALADRLMAGLDRAGLLPEE